MPIDVRKYIEEERAKAARKVQKSTAPDFDYDQWIRQFSEPASISLPPAEPVEGQFPIDDGARLPAEPQQAPAFDPESLIRDSFALATAESTERQGRPYREPVEPAIKPMSEEAAKKFNRKSIVDRIIGDEVDQQAKETAKAINQLWIESEVRKHGRQGALERFKKMGAEDPWLSVFTSGFTGGESRNMLEQLMSPLSRYSAKTAGSLAKIMLLGSAINPAMTELGETLNLGSKGIRLLSRFGGSAATLGASTATDMLTQVAEGKDITAWDATKAILSSAGYGLAFAGAGEFTGKIASPFARIPAEAATGYVAAKLTGGDDEEAALMALTFAGLGILHGPGRSLTEKEYAWNRFAKHYGKYMERTKGIPADKAEAMFRKLEPLFRKEADKMTLTEIDAIVRAMKNDADIYFMTNKPAPYKEKPAPAKQLGAFRGGIPEGEAVPALPEYQRKPIRPDATLPQGGEPIVTPAPPEVESTKYKVESVKDKVQSEGKSRKRGRPKKIDVIKRGGKKYEVVQYEDGTMMLWHRNRKRKVDERLPYDDREYNRYLRRVAANQKNAANITYIPMSALENMPATAAILDAGVAQRLQNGKIERHYDQIEGFRIGFKKPLNINSERFDYDQAPDKYKMLTGISVESFDDLLEKAQAEMFQYAEGMRDKKTGKMIEGDYEDEEKAFRDLVNDYYRDIVNAKSLDDLAQLYDRWIESYGSEEKLKSDPVYKEIELTLEEKRNKLEEEYNNEYRELQKRQAEFFDAVEELAAVEASETESLAKIRSVDEQSEPEGPGTGAEDVREGAETEPGTPGKIRGVSQSQEPRPETQDTQTKIQQIDDEIRALSTDRDRLQSRIDRAGESIRDLSQRNLMSVSAADQSGLFGDDRPAIEKRQGELIRERDAIDAKLAELAKRKENLESVLEGESSGELFDEGKEGIVYKESTYDHPKPEQITALNKAVEAAKDLPIEISPDDVDSELVYNAHRTTSFLPEEKPALYKREYITDIVNMYNELKPLAKSEEQKAILKSELERYRDGYLRRMRDYMLSHSRVASSAIVGPANFPTRTMEKRQRAVENKLSEWVDYSKRVEKSIRNKLYKQSIADQGGELAVMEKELANAKKYHEIMKKANAIIRKKIPDDEKLEQIVALGISESTARKVLKPNYMGIKGFEGFELQNNLARIKRMEKRLSEMKERESKSGKDIILKTEGVEVINNHDQERIQIIFDEIPPDDLRSKLKSRGWRWSPKNQAWQRKNTNSAIYNVNYVLKDHFDIPEAKYQRENNGGGKLGTLEEQIAIVQELLPEVTVKVVDRIKDPDGREALGKYLNGVISIAGNPKETTGYHEVVHGYLDMFVEPDERQRIFDDYRRKAKAEGLNDDEAEERIAEEFYDYYRNAKRPKSFLRRVFEKIKEIIDRLLGRIDRVKDLYNSIVAQRRPKRAPERLSPALSYQERVKAPVFFSRAEQIVKNSYPSSMKATAVMNWLARNQVKPDEIEWLDIESLVKGKDRISKDEILTWIRANDAQVQEVVRDSGKYDEKEVRDYLDKNGVYIFDDGREIETMDYGTIRIIDIDGSVLTFEKEEDAFKKLKDIYKVTKYSRFTEPGGENYRELLLTMPEERLGLSYAEEKRFNELLNKKTTAEEYYEFKRLKNKRDQIRPNSSFKSSHFDERNILAHVRFDERKDADGNRVLFIEEIQSDWAQEIKRSKFKGQSSKSIPDMPFKSEKSWSMLAFKRMIRWAAEKGFDKIAWTTGEMQAERYDLQKQVDRIGYSVDKSSKKASFPMIVRIYPKGANERPIARSIQNEAKLSEFVGKDIARRIINSEGEFNRPSERLLEGEGLAVGGEGMKAFYDKKIPAWVNKYVKKWGSKVEDVKLKIENEKLSVPAIEITPEMRGSVLYEGQPKFQKKQIDKVVDWLENQIPKEKRGEIERHYEATLLRQKIAYIKKGYRMGKMDKDRELRWLQKTIKNYAKKHLPQTNMTRGQVVPVMTDLERARSVQDIEKAWQRIDEIRTKVNRKTTLEKVLDLIDKYQPKTNDKNRMIGTTLTPIEYAKMTDIKQLVKMKPDEVTGFVQQIAQRAVKDDREPDLGEREAIYLANVFGDLRHKGPDEIQNALDEIQHIIENGRSRHRVMEEKRREMNRLHINKVIENITGGKGHLTEIELRAADLDKKKHPLRTLDDYQLGLESLLDKLERFDKNSKMNQGWVTRYYTNMVHDSRNRETKGITEAFEYLTSKLEDIYGVSGRKLSRILDEDTERIKTKILIEQNGKMVPLEISQNEACDLWMKWQDPTLHEKQKPNDETVWEVMGIDKTIMHQIENFMRPEVKAWGEFLLKEFYPKYYHGINKVFKEQFYVDLPFNPFYSPITRDVKGEREEDQLLRAKNQYASVMSGHLKNRVRNNQPLKLRDCNNVLVQQVLEMEHFKAWAGTIREMRAVLQNNAVQKAIRQYHGRHAAEILNTLIDDLARGGIDRLMTFQVADKLRANFVKAVIGLNPVTFYKQLMSVPAYAADMPVAEWIAGIGKFLANPAKALRILGESEMIKARYKIGWERDVVAAMHRGTAGRLADVKRFSDFIMWFTKFGDRAAIYFGGYPLYDYTYRQQIKLKRPEDMARKIAMREFEKATARAQQDANVQNLSHIQRAGSFAKLFTMFMTSKNQYYRQASGAWRNLREGRGPRTENMKRIIIFQFLLPMLFQWAADGFNIRWKHLIRAAIVGPWNGVFIWGDLAETAAKHTTGESWNYFFQIPVLTPGEDYARAFRRMYRMIEKDEITYEEVLKAMDEMAKGTGKVVGVPYEPVKREVKNIRDYATGKDRDIRRLLGYSEYALRGDEKKGRKAKSKVKDSTRARAYRKLIESAN